MLVLLPGLSFRVDRVAVVPGEPGRVVVEAFGVVHELDVGRDELPARLDALSARFFFSTTRRKRSRIPEAASSVTSFTRPSTDPLSRALSEPATAGPGSAAAGFKPA